MNGDFSDLLRGELLQINEVGMAAQGGDICMAVGFQIRWWYHIRVAGSEDFYFFFSLSGAKKIRPRKFAGFSNISRLS